MKSFILQLESKDSNDWTEAGDAVVSIIFDTVLKENDKTNCQIILGIISDSHKPRGAVWRKNAQNLLIKASRDYGPLQINLNFSKCSSMKEVEF